MKPQEDHSWPLFVKQQPSSWLPGMLLYFLVTTLITTWHMFSGKQNFISLLWKMHKNAWRIKKAEWMLNMPYFIALNSSSQQNHAYLSKLSSDEAVPDKPLLCSPKTFTVLLAQYSSLWVTGHRFVYMPLLFNRLRTLWGPRLIYYYYLYTLRH